MFVRMVIGELISESAAREFQTRLQTWIEETTPISPDEVHHLLDLREDDGRMVVLIFQHETRENLQRFHSSRKYRQLVARTQHLLIGDFVVKHFKEEPVHV